MKIHRFCPVYQFSETHGIRVAAPPEVVWNAAMSSDLNESVFIQSLMALRFLPARLAGNQAHREKGAVLTFDDFIEAGFIRLAEDYPREFLMGLAGRFWTLSGELLDLTPDEFIAFETTGFAKAAWNLTFDEIAPGMTRLGTETRICCMGEKARRNFLPYWALIRPFSGFIRMEMLRIIKKHASAHR